MDINNLCPHCMREVTGQRGTYCPVCGKSLDTVSEVKHQLKPFTILQGKYLVGDVLGEGGFGITYIGFDLNLEIRVAIKEFYPNGYATREANFTNEMTAYAGQSMEVVYKWRDNFLKEARSLAKCAHLSGVVGVKDFFQENNTAYIVQEYLEGITLKEYAKSQGGKVSVNWLFPTIKPVLTALGEVHKTGLIHRDISPDNIMLLKDGQMKLLDFGAARDYTQNDEKSLSVLLKPGYAPEEQYRTKGHQGPWSDIYALAGTMYKCITGVTPPEAMERMRQDTLRRPSELGIDIAPWVEQALMKAMSVFAEQRYQNMEEFYRDLYARNTTSVQTNFVPKSRVEDIKTEGTVSIQVTIDNRIAENGKAQVAPINPIEKIDSYIVGFVKKNRNVLTISVAIFAIIAIVVIIAEANSGERVSVQSAESVPVQESVSLEEEQEEKTREEQEEEPKETQEQESVEDDVDMQTVQETTVMDDVNAMFGINTATIESYAANLDPYTFLSYNSGISDFYFSYPAYLYNTVAYSEEPVVNAYGTNIQSIDFRGSDGSELIFRISQRTDNYSFEEMTEWVYNVEAGNLLEVNKLKHIVEVDYGRVIITGYDNTYSNLIYNMTKVEGDYVLQMIVAFPAYVSSEDKLQKDYITECLYRMSGFSGSSESVQSFQEYRDYWEDYL